MFESIKDAALYTVKLPKRAAYATGRGVRDLFTTEVPATEEHIQEQNPDTGAVEHYIIVHPAERKFRKLA